MVWSPWPTGSVGTVPPSSGLPSMNSTPAGPAADHWRSVMSSAKKFWSAYDLPEVVEDETATLARLISDRYTVPAASMAKSGSEKPEPGALSGGSVRSTKCHVAPWSELYHAWTWPR